MRTALRPCLRRHGKDEPRFIRLGKGVEARKTPPQRVGSTGKQHGGGSMRMEYKAIQPAVMKLIVNTRKNGSHDRDGHYGGVASISDGG